MRALLTAQLTTLQGQDYQVIPRVTITNGSGTAVDYTDWLLDGSGSDDIDQSVESFSLRFAREDGALSLAPYVAASLLNRDDAGVYAPAVDLVRVVVVESAQIPLGSAVTEADYIEIARGAVDKITWPTESNEIAVDCRDLAGALEDAQIQVEREYGAADGSVTVEEGIQQILTDNGYGAVTLFAPVATSAALMPFSQGKGSLMEAVVAVAASIGWTLGFEYDAAGTSRLTLTEPNRDAAPGSEVWTFGPDDYRDITALDTSIIDVRTEVDVVYTDLATGLRQTVTALAPQAILDKYGRRWMEIEEGDGSPIGDAASAQAFADSVLADVQEPPATHEIETFWAPHIEIGDYLKFEPNGVHYDSALYGAVTARRWSLSPTTHRTWLRTRPKPAGAFYRYIYRALDNPKVRAAGEVAELRAELTDLDTEIRGAFDGGEITSVEAIAIAEAQKQFDAEHADVEASTASLLANSALAGTPKTNLSDAWAAYDTDFDDLIAAIAAIVTDGLLPEEKTAYEDAYTAYQGTLATLSTRRQDALDAISQARALTVQYASDDQGSNSSSTFDPAIHAFMRQSTDGGATWTDWFRIVGENGASSEGRYVDYIFAVAETQPATPTGEAPAGWFDAPPAYDPATGLKLWLSRADRDGADDSLLSAWSVPVQITGPEGPGSPPVSNLRLDPALETTTHFALRYDTADEVEQMWEAAEVFDGDKPTEAMIDDVRDDIVENTLMSNVLMIPKPDEGRLAVAWLQPVAYDAEGHSIDMGGVHYVVVGTAAPFEFDVQFDESPDGTQAVLSVDVDDPRGVVTGVDVWLTTGGVETGPFAALEAGAVFSYAFLLHEHHVTPVRAAINRSDVSTPLPLGPWTADSNKVPAMPEVREERVGSTATLLVDAPDTDTTALYFKTDDGAGGLGAETSIEARGSDPRFGSFEVIADSTVQRFRVYGKNESGLAGPYRDVRVDPLTAGQPSPPDAWIYPAPGEVHNDADLAVQFGATVGAGSTGPLEWQLVIVIGDGAFDWPATWESLSLPRISIIARHARRVTSAYFRVKDGNGLITEASPYRLPPVMDGIGPTGLVDPIVPMEDGTGVFRKSLPGDPDDFDTIPDRATGGTYRKPKLGDVSTGGRIVRVRDETSGVDYTGEAVGEGVDRATAGLDSIGDVRRTVPLPRLTPVLPDVNVSSGRVTGFEGEGGLARKSDVDLGTVEVTNKKLDFIDDTVTFRKPGSGYVDGSGRVSAIFDTGVGVLRDGGQVGSGVSRANAGLNSSGDVNRNVPTTRVRGVTDPITEVPYTGTELGEGYDRAVGGLDSAGVVKKGVPVTHVSGFTGQGALATADNADDVPDGSTKRVTTTSEANGGGKADATIDTAGVLVAFCQALDGAGPKLLPKGVKEGTVRNGQTIVFEGIYNSPPIIRLQGGAVSQGANVYGLVSEADANDGNGTSGLAPPPSGGLIVQSKEADVSASAFTAHLHLIAKGAPVARSAVFGSPTTVTAEGGATGSALPASADVPSIDGTFEAKFRINCAALGSGGDVAVEVALDVALNGGVFAEVGATWVFVTVSDASSEFVDASIKAAVVGVAGGDDSFRLRVKTVVPSGSANFTSLSNPTLGWHEDPGALYASMTPNGDADAVKFFVMAQA